jgi:hypothetical protein
MSVAQTDKLIDDISQVFFQPGKRHVIGGYNLMAGGSEWSPSFVLLVATRLHGPKLNIGKN